MAKNPSSLTEKKLSNQCVYEGDFLRMHKDKIIMPNSKLSVREYVTPVSYTHLTLPTNREV